MITEIGIVAGEIWHYLDKHNTVVFSEVVGAIDRPRELALMSLGWLAREGHVVVQAERDSFKVTLRRQKS